jgi:hypothetical protein
MAGKFGASMIDPPIRHALPHQQPDVDEVSYHEMQRCIRSQLRVQSVNCIFMLRALAARISPQLLEFTVALRQYASIHVDHEEVVRILGAPLPDAKSIETFSKVAGINQPTRMRRLILNGHTPSTMMVNPATKTQQHYLTEDDAAAFNSKFMTLRMIAQEYERNWQSIGAELKAKGVTPFSPDGEISGNLFLRKEVQAKIN